jgi:hypothetical protein
LRIHFGLIAYCCLLILYSFSYKYYQIIIDLSIYF